jgi:hypothetical protein
MPLTQRYIGYEWSNHPGYALMWQYANTAAVYTVNQVECPLLEGLMKCTEYYQASTFCWMC